MLHCLLITTLLANMCSGVSCGTVTASRQTGVLPHGKQQRFVQVQPARARSTVCRAQQPEVQQYAVQHMHGDGRCLFRALAQGSHQLQHKTPFDASEETRQADNVRTKICDALLAKRQDISPFIDEDFDLYVANMRRSHTWGGKCGWNSIVQPALASAGEPELSVAPDVLDCGVQVFDTGGQPISEYHRSGDQEQEAGAVSLLFHGLGHYDLLLPVANPTSKL